MKIMADLGKAPEAEKPVQAGAGKSVQAKPVQQTPAVKTGAKHVQPVGKKSVQQQKPVVAGSAVKGNAKEEKPAAAKKMAQKKEKPKIETKAIAPLKLDKLSQQDLELALRYQDVLLFPLVTEKAVHMIEGQNRVSFVVAKESGKTDVKKAVEFLFGVKVQAVNVVRDMKGRKKAMVKISPVYKAQDIATRLGVI